MAPRIHPELLAPTRSDAFSELKLRRLTADTLRRSGYFRADFKGEVVQVAPYYDQNGDLFQQKLRFPDKSFPILKAKTGGEPKLFLQQVFGDRYDRKVIITEGELDALSVAQVLDWKTAVVSLTRGAAGAVKDLKTNWRWLDRFEEIVLWFDDDEPGRLAAEESAKLFAVGKVRIAKAPGAKDASDLLQANRPGDILAAIYAATKWSPAGIVNAADCADDMDEEPETDAWSYPWEGLQDYTGGQRPGEVTYHVAGTGIGKTTLLCEVAHHLLFGQEPSSASVKIGFLAFEALRRDIQLAILSVHASRRLDLEPVSKEAKRRMHQEVFGGRRVELFDPETAEWSVDAILSYVRYMASALDCKVIFIDPLSFIIAGLAAQADERRTLDKVAMDLAKLSKELAIHIHITHHLKRSDGVAHEEGGEISLNEVRGSGGIANFANSVIGWERNQQGDRADLMRARVLKNRKKGRTGVAQMLSYDDKTGRLHPSTDAWPETTSRSRKKAGGFNSQEINDY